MKLILFVLTSVLAAVTSCYGQEVTYIGHATLSGKPKDYTLVDKATGTKYVLDADRIFIAAIDSNGKQLWKTDPWKDNKLEAYRVSRPVVSRFGFDEYYYGDEVILSNKLKGEKAKEISDNRGQYTKEVIWIVYNNTQFGFVDKSNGKFEFFGQD